MYKSSFLGLNTALRGVLAQQTALDVTGHNIANLNTAGYTRQRAEMTTAPPWSSAAFNSQVTPGQLGTGVEVLRIGRMRDQYIDRNARLQFGSQASAQTTVSHLQEIEAAFQEPGPNGLSALMQNFWSTMDAVASQPDSTSARQAFAQAAQSLATGFRQIDARLTQVSDEADTRLDATVGEINGITQRIATLNGQIAGALQHGQQPNDLLDERDRLMDDLSSRINYTWTEAPTGEVTITFGTTTPIPLVDPLAAGGFTPVTRADLDNAHGNGDLTSGRAFADEQLFTVTVPAIRTSLDQLAADFVNGINGGHAAGFDLNGAAGGNVFDPGGLTAGSIQIDPGNDIVADPRLIAAASSWGGTGEPGNGQNLASMLDSLRPAAQAALGGATWESYYTSVVTGVGAQSASAQRDAANAAILVDLAVNRREQVSGVSLDEEMSNMLRFQHAYNASARVMTAMDDALDTIINRMGRVGL